MSNDNDIQKRAFDFAKWAGGYMAPKCKHSVIPYDTHDFPEERCPTCAKAREWRDKEWLGGTYSTCSRGDCGHYPASNDCDCRYVKHHPNDPTFCACSFIKELEAIGVWGEIKGRLTVDDTHNLPSLVEECEKFREVRG